MALDTWIAFTLVSVALLSMPGPITLFVISSSLNHGKRRAAIIIPGVMLGDSVAMICSLFGLGVVIAQRPMMLTVVKSLGALILLIIGIRSIAKAQQINSDRNLPAKVETTRLFAAGFGLAALHPSSFVFFTAFAPQFIDPSRSFSIQAFMLVATFLLVGGIVSSVWLLIADSARNLITNEVTLRHFQEIGGALIIVFSLVSIAMVFLP